jgi:hypothetical protein
VSLKVLKVHKALRVLTVLKAMVHLQGCTGTGHLMVDLVEVRWVAHLDWERRVSSVRVAVVKEVGEAHQDLHHLACKVVEEPLLP